MSSGRSWPSLGGNKETARPASSGENIVKMGYLKKLKTMKKKYFVLRGDSSEASACLEYYDSEKKFKCNHAPKRSITLKTCFNINKRNDTRQKWVIALYTKNDCFCLVMETEEELEDWLKMLLTLQHGEDVPDGEQPKPTFKHVWQVTVKEKELGCSRNILGPYLLCLTDRTLTLVKMDSDKSETIEFKLHCIRRCGDLDSFFYMEVGQMAVTGAGNLWMETEDNIIAQNMHAAILSACKNCKDFGPMRNRSSSTNESLRQNVVPRPYDGHPRWPGLTGLTDPRGRCDSLPSTRNRTTSETSHMPHQHRHSYLQPNSTRPLSMYTRTISYSPPVVDSSPVSPESRGFSTDSAGSSLSMEGEGMEIGDGPWEGSADKYGHSLTPDEPVILEENPDDCETVQWQPDDDYVAPDKNMCLTINNYHSHKNLHNPNNSGFKSSSPSQGSLADVCSPCGSSPLESNAYMTMSPGDKPTGSVNFCGNGAMTGNVSVNHSRGSSLAEDGYVHMAPMLHDDGYVDMESGGRHRHNADHFRSGELSPASSCSITSGTPSTDIRFSEYTLEKVSTYITPSEDEITPSERPTRAYSVGSRPAFNKRNEATSQSDCEQRVRAFSVGSRCPRIHSAHLTPPPRHPLSSSHSSVGNSEDLMELDFTRNSKSRSRNHSKKPSSSERLSVPPSSVVSSAASSYSTAEGSYMEMSPRSSPKPSDNEMDGSHYCPSPPKCNRISNFIGRSPPKSYIDMKPNFSSSSPPVSGLSSAPLYKVPEGDSSYVEMTSNESRGLLPSCSPPVLLHSIRDERPNSPSADSYMEMQPAKSIIAKNNAPRVDSFPVTEQSKSQNFMKTASPPIKTALVPITNPLKSRHSLEDYLDMNIKRKLSLVEDNNNKIMIERTNPIDTPKKPPDGYVEMTVGNPKPTRKPSLDNFKGGDFDYMNMTGNGKKERKGSRKDRNNISRYSSQPIAIQSAVSKDQSSSSTSPVFTFVGRKHSTGTPPKVPSYLPLGNSSISPSSSPYSSLGRRTRKTPSRRESKELSSSGSSTPIFPLSLNSPSSPMKPLGSANNKDKDNYECAAKCPVDARSGTVRICYSPAENPTMSPQSHLRQASGNVVPEQNDYINFNPLTTELKENDDYTLMKPVNPLEPSRKISAPPILSNMKSMSIDKIVFGVSNLTISSPEINSVPNNSNNDNVNNNTSDNSDCKEMITSSCSEVKNISDISDLKASPSIIYSNNNTNSCNSSHIDSEVLSINNEREVSSNCSSDVSVATVVTATSSANFSSVPTTSSSSSVNTSFDLSSPAIATVNRDSVGRTVCTSGVNISAAPNSGATTSITSASSSGGKEIHYASLDLARSDSTEDNSNNFNGTRPLRNQSSTSSASTPSPNISQNAVTTLTYAEIDFSKSNCSNNANSTVH